MKPLLRWSIQGWLADTTVVTIVVASFLAVLAIAPVSAAPEEEAPLECLSCHTRMLRSHDILGSGSEACWACHDRKEIGKLRLADGTRLSMTDSPRLCGQCHQGRYNAWREGTHGGSATVKCITCHNPHDPEINLADIASPPRVAEPAAPGVKAPLQCLDCHKRVLKAHDKLGSGNDACWSCHYDMTMGALHLAGGGTLLSLADSPRLCAQCHQKRYNEWDNGTHGMPAWEEGTVEVHGTERVGCIGCHDPHQPQIVLSKITKPHPEVTPPPPSPPMDLLIIVGVSFLVIVGVGVVIARRGEGS